jgi:hypothetical protein
MNNRILSQKIKKFLKEAIGDKPTTDKVEVPPVSQKKKTAIQTKVVMFFQNLQKNQQLMSLLNFTSPLEKRQAIMEFGKMIGLSPADLVTIVSNYRNIDQKDTEQDTPPPKEQPMAKKKISKPLPNPAKKSPSLDQKKSFRKD